MRVAENVEADIEGVFVMTKAIDNNTGKPIGFYERGKALFDRIPPFIPARTTAKKYPVVKSQNAGHKALKDPQ